MSPFDLANSEIAKAALAATKTEDEAASLLGISKAEFKKLLPAKAKTAPTKKSAASKK